MTRPAHRAPVGRRGSVYVLVLAAGVVLTALGVATLGISRVQGRNGRLSRDAARASDAAQSAIELASSVVNADPTGSTWRVAATSHALAAFPIDPRTSAGATIQDSDGTLLNADPDGAIYIIGDGSSGGARRRLRATLNPELTPIESLSTCLWSDGALAFTAATVYGSGVVGSNTRATATTSTVNPRVGAPIISGSTYVGTTRLITGSVAMPTAAAVDTWAAQGTAISYASTTGTLRQIVLSSGSNPFGVANASGIYVIDCRGSDITLRQIRVLGTLVLLNTGPGSMITDSCFLEAPSVNRPVLIVSGPMTFKLTAADLSEATAGVNFNPAGSPHRGTADADLVDFYPSMVRGLVYVSGNVAISQAATFEGVVLVGGTTSISDTCTFRHWKPEATVAGFRTVTGWTVLDTSAAAIVDP